MIQRLALLPGGDWYAGDVDPNGNYWIASPGGGTTIFGWARIDANPASDTWETVLEQNTTAESPFHCQDWAYVPGGGSNL